MPFLSRVFSTIDCVAMLAWSSPGTQSALCPDILCQRVRASYIHRVSWTLHVGNKNLTPVFLLFLAWQCADPHHITHANANEACQCSLVTHTLKSAVIISRREDSVGTNKLISFEAFISRFYYTSWKNQDGEAVRHGQKPVWVIHTLHITGVHSHAARGMLKWRRIGIRA